MIASASARQRLAAALDRRIGPGKSVSQKVAAAGVGRSADTIGRWMRDEVAAPVDGIAELDRFFAARGDFDLLAEVFPEMATRRPAAVPAGDRAFVISDDGHMVAAPHGPAQHVREVLRLHPAAQVDAPVYALRMLGWVELTARTDGRLIIRKAVGVSPEAARRAAAWLAEQGRAWLDIEIRTLQGEAWATRRYDTLRAAVAALEAAAANVDLADQISTSIRAARLNPDTMADPAQVALRRAWCGRAAPLDSMLAELRTLPGHERASLLRRDDDGWTVVSAGPGTCLRRDLDGRRLADMRDQVYGDMVAAQLDAVMAEGQPALHDLAIRTRFDGGAYRRLALPLAGPGGLPFVLSLADIYQAPRAGGAIG